MWEPQNKIELEKWEFPGSDFYLQTIQLELFLGRTVYSCLIGLPFLLLWLKVNHFVMENETLTPMSKIKASASHLRVSVRKEAFPSQGDNVSESTAICIDPTVSNGGSRTPCPQVACYPSPFLLPPQRSFGVVSPGQGRESSFVRQL